MGCSSSAAAPSLGKPLFAIDFFATDFFDSYRLDAKIGQGAFAQVRLLGNLQSGKCESDESAAQNQEKCVKIIDVRNTRQPGRTCVGLQRLALMEVQIWKSVGRHPNVIDFHAAYIQSNICFLVMERCHWSLYEYMGEMPDLNERSFGKLVFQMLSAIYHLHASGVVHRDVKYDNFLVSERDGNTVKLCDFGLAAILPDHGKLCGPVGTTPFMCPETLLGEWYNESADIWSLAVMIYAFFFGCFPYESGDGTNEGMKKAIIKGKPPKFESCGQGKKPYSPSALNFITTLLKRDAKDRPSAEQALNLPYVAMAKTSGYMKGLALPSLRPMLNSLRKIGAVSVRNLSRKCEMDDLLSVVQFQKLGIRMPHTWKSHNGQKEDIFVSRQPTDSSTLSAISESASSTRYSPSPECSFKSRPMSL
jgi:serine/threonine protein kinase